MQAFSDFSELIPFFHRRVRIRAAIPKLSLRGAAGAVAISQQTPAKSPQKAIDLFFL
jgi:hypothetical protein